MENYDGQHSAKRQRTDGDGNSQRPNQGGNFYNYSNQRQSSRGSGNAGNDEEKVNHVLLMTVINPAYPITVDVIRTICDNIGQVIVMRIVIFKKNGVQAMVEFDGVESAKRAKQQLNGADIYSGCCTLKIEYAKPTRLNVYKNDSESWDYTNPGLGKSPERLGPLLQEPRFGGAPTPFRGGDSGRALPAAGNFTAPEHNEPYDGYGTRSGNSFGNYSGQSEHYNSGSQERYGPHHERFGGRDGYDGRTDGSSGHAPRYQQQMHGTVGGSGGSGGVPQQGAVMMVYGVNSDKVNAEKLFNLFCLYGNVVRVKFLKSKEGCAMIQMGDAASVDRAVRNLNHAVLFNKKLQLSYSKQAFLNDVHQPYELPDGTQSFKDFMGNRNNRFTNPEAASKNRIQPPSKVLHFFNTPYGITEEDMKKVFEKEGSTPPKAVRLFASRSKSERSSSGLLEWDNASNALEALVICNHTPIPNPNGKFPYILKLCFSSGNTRAV